MEFPGSAVHSLVPVDPLTGLVYGILRILALSAMGVVIAGMIISCFCDLSECRKWRRYHGRSRTCN